MGEGAGARGNERDQIFDPNCQRGTQPNTFANAKRALLRRGLVNDKLKTKFLEGPTKLLYPNCTETYGVGDLFMGLLGVHDFSRVPVN